MITRKRFSALTTVLALVLAFTFSLDSASAQDGDVVEIINNSEDHTIFANMLEETELNAVISEQGPFTVIAPTDAAFEELGEELEQIQSNPERMQNLVIGHLFQGEVTAEEAGPAIGVEVEQGDIDATNGLVHIVGSVIMN
ncbi:MAG: fasciclin domain-containing protein [Balneolaceae bacterium]